MVLLFIFNYNGYLNIAIISFLPVQNPPLAPPKAFPKVPETISMSFKTLNNSGVPIPF